MPSSAPASNPLLEGLGLRRRPEPCVLVVFGASGDLTRRKLVPALYALSVRGLLPEPFAVLGAARSAGSDEGFRTQMRDAVREFARDEFDEQAWARLASTMRYVCTDLADPGAEESIVAVLNELDERLGTRGNRVYYLAIPPDAVIEVVDDLGRNRATDGWTRLVVEKPFGRDRESARRLNESLARWFDEREIFRIDHYLGKETVQNLLALRFANGIFEPIWNRQFVDHVQITVAESIGIEGRGAFYEQAGAVRDVFQNHALQLVTLTAMEPPIEFSADFVRNEKVKVLHAMRELGPGDVVRGQYGAGVVEGLEVPGYRDEDRVAPDSVVDTYVAARLHVDNWRWADTPFYVRVGKRMPRRETTIAIQFKRAPHPPFESEDGLRPNVLLVHVQPNEGVSLGIGVKVPGQRMTIRTVNMDFVYGGAFREALPEAYERLILDAMLGDATLFTRADEVDQQWAIVDAIAGGWSGEPEPYDAGTWGPEAADELLHRDGRSWRRH